MIDIHCHILPGVDDGPPDMEAAVDLARAAAAAGVCTIVATPHIREDHPFDRASIPARADEVREAVAAAGIELELLTGGEVALSMLDLLDDSELELLCLGRGRYLLIESPYGAAGDFVETMLFDLQMRGFRPVLAHPERSPSFQRDPARLGRLVEAGVLSSITAGSMAGRFGSEVRRVTANFFRAGLVHDVASDAHDIRGRPPGAGDAFDVLERELRGIAGHERWCTREVPAAIVTGADLPERPGLPRRRRLFG